MRPRILLGPLGVTVLVAGLCACSQPPISQEAETRPQDAGSTALGAAEVIRVTVPEGTELHMSLSTAVNSGTTQVGDTFSATTTAPVVVGDRVAIPTGSTVHGHVRGVNMARQDLKISDKGGAVGILLERVTTPQGFSARMSASFANVASSSEETAGIIGGSAAGGAPLGRVLSGRSRDAAIGALLGGGIGIGIAAGTNGTELVLPVGTGLTVTLDQPMTIASR